RSPGWDTSPHTVELLLDHGFEYDSSLMGNDYEPYWCRIGDAWSSSTAYVWGRPVALVEVPVAWHLDDWLQFEYTAVPGYTLPALRAPSTPLEIWQGEFDYLYQRLGAGLLTITMHPQVIGRGHRLLMLERFLEYISQHNGVAFTRCADYAREWR